MLKNKLSLIASFLLIFQVSFTAIAGEKGGNGTLTEEFYTLQIFQNTYMCPEVPAIELCKRLEKEQAARANPMKSDLEKLEEDFFNSCCQQIDLEKSPQG